MVAVKLALLRVARLTPEPVSAKSTVNALVEVPPDAALMLAGADDSDAVGGVVSTTNEPKAALPAMGLPARSRTLPATRVML